MADIRLQTAPHTQQLLFMDADEREQLFGGAKRGGKSHGLAQKIIMLSQAFPGNRGLLYRQNLTDLKDSTLVTFELVCPSGLIRQHHKGDRKYIFNNGSHFIYRGIGDKDELEKVKGIDLGWMAGDEPSEVDEASYLMLLAQLNWKLPNGKRPPYMSLLACNPEPGWVKRRFIDDLEQDRQGRYTTFHAAKDRVFIPSLPNDNPYLPPGYVEWLKANFPAEWVDKYVRGSWEVSEGMVYKEFDRSVHVVDSYPPLADMHFFGGIDHGTTGVTTFIVIGVTANHDYFVIREYYRKDRLVTEHAAAMQNIIDELGAAGATLEYIVIDPATNQRSSQGNYQLQDVRSLYAECGIHTIPGWNLIEAGVERVRQLIHVNPNHFHPTRMGEGGARVMGSPHLFVYSQCRNTIDEFQGWKKDIDPNGYVKYKGSDHALDPIRYIVVSRPVPPSLADSGDKGLDPFQRSARRSHDKWAAGFDKQVRKARGQSDSHFGYLNTR